MGLPHVVVLRRSSRASGHNQSEKGQKRENGKTGRHVEFFDVAILSVSLLFFFFSLLSRFYLPFLPVFPLIKAFRGYAVILFFPSCVAAFSSRRYRFFFFVVRLDFLSISKSPKLVFLLKNGAAPDVVVLQRKNGGDHGPQPE